MRLTQFLVLYAGTTWGRCISDGQLGERIGLR